MDLALFAQIQIRDRDPQRFVGEFAIDERVVGHPFWSTGIEFGEPLGRFLDNLLELLALGGAGSLAAHTVLLNRPHRFDEQLEFLDWEFLVLDSRD